MPTQNTFYTEHILQVKKYIIIKYLLSFVEFIRFSIAMKDEKLALDNVIEIYAAKRSNGQELRLRGRM